MSIPKGYSIAGVRAGWRIVTDKSERRLARLASRLQPRRKGLPMTTITDWNAKRSGASITVAGKDGAKPVKLSIREIAKRAGKTIATALDGTSYELA